MGNLLVDDDANVVAILDWELAAVGPAELDLGWYLALDALQARFVKTTLPGFPDRAGTLAAWERGVGRAAVDVSWHEVFALVRSTAIHDHQSRLAVANGDQPAYVSGNDNPLVRYLMKQIERFPG
jgi:aminoglycoside phosphotransferase (APT) family kinase protein